jgi:hypothetical protein
MEVIAETWSEEIHDVLLIGALAVGAFREMPVNLSFLN